MPAGGGVTATSSIWGPIIVAGAATLANALIGGGPPPANKAIGPPVIGDKVNTNLTDDPTADGRHYIGPDGTTYRLDNEGALVPAGPASDAGAAAYDDAVGVLTEGPGGDGGEGGSEDSGFGVSDAPLPDFLTLQRLGYTDADIKSLLDQGLANVAQNRALTGQAITDLGTLQGWRQSYAGNIADIMAEQSERLLNEQYSLAQQARNVPPIDFEITQPDVTGPDFQALSSAMYGMASYQIYKDLAALVGPEYASWINVSDPATLQTLIDAGVITAAEAAELGDPSSPLSTEVGTLQTQFAKQGGMRALAGPYMAATGQAIAGAEDALGQARQQATVDAYTLLLQQQRNDTAQFANLVAQQGNQVQGLGIAGNALGQTGNYLNNFYGQAMNLGNFAFDPGIPATQGSLATQMPTGVPESQWMFNTGNLLAQQQFQNELANRQLQVSAEAASQGSPFANQPFLPTSMGAMPAVPNEYMAALQGPSNLLTTMTLLNWWRQPYTAPVPTTSGSTSGFTGGPAYDPATLPYDYVPADFLF